ncbi:hypothetical protein KKF91_08315 [Myxococcota bacterium]|nr:hypothetical protein [Myxococcota bacterium]MBU1430542.1 hypothetical protein [Myxococcota bacterium]MBU1897759.1 hypothetical protein [Myxococcota bacterium]
MRISLKQLMTLYLFTWTQANTLVRMLKDRIQSLQIQDDRLSHFIDQLEQQAANLNQAQLHQSIVKKSSMAQPRHDLRTALSQVRKLVVQMRSVLSPEQPAAIILDGWISSLFREDQIRKSERSSADLLAIVRFTLEQMKPEDVAQFGVTLVESRENLRVTYEALKRAVEQVEQATLQAKMSTRPISPREAQRVQRDALYQLAAHVVAHYYDPNQNGGHIFEALAGAIDEVNQVARAHGPAL